MMNPAPHTVERWTGRILKLGVWSSSALMILGLVRYALSPESMPPTGLSMDQIVGEWLRVPLEPASLMFGGLVLLMLTPFLRVLAAIVGFAAERDRRFVGVSLLVFAMLMGELLYTWLRG